MMIFIFYIISLLWKMKYIKQKIFVESLNEIIITQYFILSWLAILIKRDLCFVSFRLTVVEKHAAYTSVMAHTRQNFSVFKGFNVHESISNKYASHFACYRVSYFSYSILLFNFASNLLRSSTTDKGSPQRRTFRVFTEGSWFLEL